MVDIQIVSDLHLESPPAYDTFQIPPATPYLALLGDIGVVNDENFFVFIEAQLHQFEIVFLLLGNHEPYHSNWTIAKDKVSKFADTINEHVSPQHSLGRFVFLNQTRYDLSPTVTILGCTLHSKVSDVHQEHVSFGINDFYYIEDWTIQSHNAAHQADLKWLNEQVAHIAACEPDRIIAIFTHHSPAARDHRANDPTHTNSPLSSGFTTDLSAQPCWTNPQVRLWAFGHTHFNCHYVEESTGKTVLSNQRGYYFRQAERFDVAKAVHI